MSKEEEKWAEIPHSSGYWASNLGKIRSKYCIKQPFLQGGQYRVCIRYRGKFRNIAVSRLVLMAFIGESDLLAIHADGNRKNDRLDNLYYGTKRDISRRNQC